MRTTRELSASLISLKDVSRSSVRTLRIRSRLLTLRSPLRKLRRRLPESVADASESPAEASASVADAPQAIGHRLLCRKHAVRKVDKGNRDETLDLPHQDGRNLPRQGLRYNSLYDKRTYFLPDFGESALYRCIHGGSQVRHLNVFR